MRKIKTIDQIPQIEMDAWQAAEHMFGKDALDANHLLAGEAYQQMVGAGWEFVDYNDYGEEVWEPPKNQNEVK